jgi:hypothetical protein
LRRLTIEEVDAMDTTSAVGDIVNCVTGLTEKRRLSFSYD